MCTQVFIPGRMPTIKIKNECGANKVTVVHVGSNTVLQTFFKFFTFFFFSFRIDAANDSNQIVFI